MANCLAPVDPDNTESEEIAKQLQMLPFTIANVTKNLVTHEIVSLLKAYLIMRTLPCVMFQTFLEEEPTRNTHFKFGNENVNMMGFKNFHRMKL